MPIWNGFWGAPWGWFWWIMPLVGLLLMVMMAFVCFRMGGCMAGHGRHPSCEVEDLRVGIRELRQEIQKLRERS